MVAAHDALFMEWRGTGGDLSHVRAAARHRPLITMLPSGPNFASNGSSTVCPLARCHDQI
jgi:hypothetical protein